MKTVCVALVMTLAPGLALAECFSGHADNAVMSCPQGQTLDTATDKCVPLTTG